MRMGISLVVMLVLIGAVWFVTRPAPIINYPPKNSTIVAFGDSLVYGQGATKGHDFVSLLSTSLGVPIVNLGVPGNTTEDGVARMGAVDQNNPGIVSASGWQRYSEAHPAGSDGEKPPHSH